VCPWGRGAPAGPSPPLPSPPGPPSDRPGSLLPGPGRYRCRERCSRVPAPR